VIAGLGGVAWPPEPSGAAIRFLKPPERERAFTLTLTLGN